MPDSLPPLGAHWMENELRVSVWAPRCKSLHLEIERSGEWSPYPMRAAAGGVYWACISCENPDARYRFVLDGQRRRPDPRSRYQGEGVHGPSQVVSPDRFCWSDAGWSGVQKSNLVIYELHVGALTRKGTFDAAIGQLDRLMDLGVTAIELLPVAQSAGRWNWGYDGVQLFAVRETFGGPEGLRRLVDACHQRGLAVIMDVVYNHLGPEGNYLSEFAPYFSRRHRTPWGDAFHFDGRQSGPVRQYVIDNAVYWLREYHLDGLRLDAVHFMFDDSERHILHDIRDAVSAFEETVGYPIHLIAEANIFDDELLGFGEEAPYDAIWCDDLMHSLYATAVPDVSLTPRTYRGLPDVTEALRHAYLYRIPGATRVDDSERSPDASRSYLKSLVTALQTHDAVGNHPHGKRIHELTSLEFQRAAAALMLLYPTIPLMFMGEETATDARFPFFADFGDQRLRKAVDDGRRHEYPHHQWDGAPLPSDPRAFHEANLETAAHDPEMLQWYRTLLSLRRQLIQEGLLDPEQQRELGSSESGLCGYQYGEHGPFVLANLGRSVQDVHWHGLWSLDSRQTKQGMLEQTLTGRSDHAVVLEPSHAIVGHGSIQKPI